MNGKLAGGFIVISALLTGAAVWYLQMFGFYHPVEASAPAAELRLTSINSGQPEPILTDGFEGIDADSSPLRFRGCFRTSMSLAMLTESYEIYPEATPLTAPYWFRCFDAGRIGADLETGEAVAFLSEKNIRPGVDRVIAVYPDGRAFAWHQINETMEE